MLQKKPPTEGLWGWWSGEPFCGKLASVCREIESHHQSRLGAALKVIAAKPKTLLTSDLWPRACCVSGRMVLAVVALFFFWMNGANLDLNLFPFRPATMDLTTAYRYNQNMMEYYTCKSESISKSIKIMPIHNFLSSVEAKWPQL